MAPKGAQGEKTMKVLVRCPCGHDEKREEGLPWEAYLCPHCGQEMMIPCSAAAGDTTGGRGVLCATALEDGGCNQWCQEGPRTDRLGAGTVCCSPEAVDVNPPDGCECQLFPCRICEAGLINLTPHRMTILTGEDEWVLRPSESGIPRVETGECEEIGSIGGIPVRTTTLGRVVGLPDPKPGVWLIVSSIVRTHPDAKLRTDLLSPDTSPKSVVRDDDGNIVAVTGFQQ